MALLLLTFFLKSLDSVCAAFSTTSVVSDFSTFSVLQSLIID